MHKIFYFKNKLFDFHIKLPFIEIKIYLNNFFSLLIALLKPQNYLSAYRLYKSNNSQNILIIELNNFHGEIFPSWLFYLKKLNYDNKIIFLSPKAVYKEKPFDLLNPSEKNSFSFYKVDQKIILLLYKIGFFQKYKKVIFNSDGFYLSSIDRTYFQIPQVFQKKNILSNNIFLSHLILQAFNHQNQYVNFNKQNITISPTIAKNANINYVFPLFNNNLYKQNTKKQQIFETNKIFVSCGNIKINNKDSDGLFISLNKLNKYKKVINIIGKIPKKHYIKHYKEINHYKDKVSYTKLKRIMLESHFILFLLNNKQGYGYKFNNLSGNLPLALNFNLIPIIEESFAKIYCLNKKNAIIYKEGYLSEAIEYVCNMKYDEYLKLQSSLSQLKNKVRKASLNNIRKILKF